MECQLRNTEGVTLQIGPYPPAVHVSATVIHPAEFPRQEPMNDADSGCSISCESGTTSLESWARNVMDENGRTYHTYDCGEYPLPNDEEEQRRLNLTDKFWSLLLCGKLYLAPLSLSIDWALDLGTGTGRWAISFGDEMPRTNIIGNDLSPIQPSWVPPNVLFEIDNIEKTWLFDQSFGFIHIRDMGGSVRDWQMLCAQSFKFSTVGGFIEFQELDINIYEKGGKIPKVVETWLALLHSAAEKFQKELSVGRSLQKYVTAAGFEDVKETKYEISLGAQEGLGQYLKEIYLLSIEAYSLALFTRVLDWHYHEVIVLLAEVCRALEESMDGLYCVAYVVNGRKPFHCT